MRYNSVDFSAKMDFWYKRNSLRIKLNWKVLFARKIMLLLLMRRKKFFHFSMTNFLTSWRQIKWSQETNLHFKNYTRRWHLWFVAPIRGTKILTANNWIWRFFWTLRKHSIRSITQSWLKNWEHTASKGSLETGSNLTSIIDSNTVP